MRVTLNHVAEYHHSIYSRPDHTPYMAVSRDNQYISTRLEWRNQFHENYLNVFDDLDRDALRLGDDNTTLYKQAEPSGFNCTHTQNVWIPISNVEKGYDITNHIVELVTPYVTEECLKHPRVKRGVTMDRRAWKRVNNTIEFKSELASYDEIKNAYSANFGGYYTSGHDSQLLQQAWQWAKTITVDTPSASNLMKMLTSAALGTDDIRAYIVCGGDTRWVEPLLQAFRKQFPHDYTDMSQSTLFSPMGAYSYKIFYDRIATVIDQYEPHHIAIVLTERLTGLATLQKSKSGQYGFIRVRKDLPTDTYSQWEQFIADEGRYAFLLLSCNLWRKQKTSVHTVNLKERGV